jgi:OOP family OmpA-OmpF porin
MKRTVLALALATLSAAAFAQSGYATQSGTEQIWMNPFGLCWRSGFWTPEQAAAPCDATPQAAPVAAPQAAAPVQPLVAEPKLEPAPAPIVQAPAAAPAPVAVQPTYEKVTLSADVLFDFNKATLKDAGQQKLDELAARLRGASLDEIKIVGHADRIGSPQYNKRLSEERAKTVKAYLESRANARSIQTAGRGSAEPVTGATCKSLGAEQGSNRRLVQCLQADRRVDIELFGVRTAGDAGTRDAASGSGAPQPASFTGSR